uniref:Bestrophin homolog n=1 Tax=Syphacia muris TaxID=451379 RepID=A0A0N5APH6_9BILA
MPIGYITSLEAPFIEDTKFWLPVKWAFHLAQKARNDGFISSDQGVCTTFRREVIGLYLTDWIPVPLLYTQVMLTCVRIYFLVALIAQQYVDAKSTNGKITPIDAYIPFLEIIQFLCYVGWMKVAEALVNPFGDDDSDFETYLIVKRNLGLALSTVDENIYWIPSLKRDVFWNERNPDMLYTVETANIEQHPNLGSAAIRMQSRRLSHDSRMIMIKRGSDLSFPTALYDYVRLPETKVLRPIIDNSYSFELSSDGQLSDTSLWHMPIKKIS